MSTDINDIIARAERGDREATVMAVRHYHRLNDWGNASRLTQRFRTLRSGESFLEATLNRMYSMGVLPDLVEYVSFHDSEAEARCFTTWEDFASHAQNFLRDEEEDGMDIYPLWEEVTLVGSSWWMVWFSVDSPHWDFLRMPAKPTLQKSIRGVFETYKAR